MSASSSINRRTILSGLMKLLVLIGFIFIAIAFSSSFTTSSIDEKQNASSRWVMTVAVSELVEGKVKSLQWAGGIAWVYKRTTDDIKQLNLHNDVLRDFSSSKSDQPEHMKNGMRSADKQIFVFIPNESKRSCQVSLNTGADIVRFTEPCYAAKYDAAGRILDESGHHDKTQQNLAVPNHLIEDGILKIGIWMPKI